MTVIAVANTSSPDHGNAFFCVIKNGISEYFANVTMYYFSFYLKI